MGSAFGRVPFSAASAADCRACWLGSRRAKEKALQKAKASAGGMLLRRPHSVAELRSKLTDRGHPEDAIDAAIARLQELVRPLMHKPDCTAVPSSLSKASRQPPDSPQNRLHAGAAAFGGNGTCCHQRGVTIGDPAGQGLDAPCLADNVDAHNSDDRCGPCDGCWQGQQSDSEYAAVLARSKWRQSRWAPSRIRMVLLTCITRTLNRNLTSTLSLTLTKSLISTPTSAPGLTLTVTLTLSQTREPSSSRLFSTTRLHTLNPSCHAAASAAQFICKCVES